jgi:CHAT domain-containing protein
MQSDSAIPPLGCQRILAIAERDPQRATALVRRLPRSPGEHPWHDYTFGRVFLACEQIDEAAPPLAAAAGHFRAAGDTLAALECDYALLQIAFARGASDALASQFDAIARQFTALGAHAAAFRARVQLALLYDSLGRAPDADKLLSSIDAEREHATPLDQARWLVARGVTAASARSDFSTAITHLEDAERRFHHMHANIDRAKCWFQQAWIYAQQGELHAAEALYTRAEHAFERYQLPIRKALLNRGMGNFAMVRGQYSEALHRTLTAQRQFEALGRTNDVAQCVLNLGNLYYFTGWWSLAAAHYQRAEQLAAALDATGWELTCRRNRALALYRNRKLDEALALQQSVERAARAAGQSALAAETRGDMATVLSELGQYQAADDYYELARKELIGLRRDYYAADFASDHGWSLLRRGEHARAAPIFAAVAPALRDYPSIHWRVQYGLARCAELDGEIAAALEHYRAASQTAAQLRSGLTLEAASSTLFAQAADLHADALRCAAQAGDYETLLMIDNEQRAAVLYQFLATRPLDAAPEINAALAIQQRQIEALEADETLDDATRVAVIGQALASYNELLLHARHSAPPVAAGQLRSSAQLDLPRLRHQLASRYGDEWTVLLFAQSRDTLLILTLTPRELLLDQTAWDSGLAEMLRRASREHIYIFTDGPFRGGRTTRPWNLLHALGERLIPPATQQRLNPAHRLLIVPSEQLHQVAWGALRVGDGWLAEQAVLQQVPALAIWSMLAERPASQSRHALLLGCGKFRNGQAALPAIGAELDKVASVWPGPHLRWQDADATRAALLARSASGALQNDALLHLATHASLIPEHAQRAHITLWDDDMWLDEIATLRLGGALVTISACEGAGAASLPGNEVLSLSWAFLAAGAHAVLASLWPISDAVAPDFMQNFYTALHRTGDAAQALAETQRAIILRFEEDHDPLARPLIWASFVVTGAP